MFPTFTLIKSDAFAAPRQLEYLQKKREVRKRKDLHILDNFKELKKNNPVKMLQKSM